MKSYFGKLFIYSYKGRSPFSPSIKQVLCDNRTVDEKEKAGETSKQKGLEKSKKGN